MTPPETPATVLVVEDERRLADSFAGWLEPDYDVRTVYSGHAALERYDEAVDVVLLDRRLPDVPGREVLRRIRDRAGDPQVCMVTALEPDFDIVTMGFDDYVTKPVFAEDLRGVVETALVRNTYRDRVQELYALASKLAVLESARPNAELRLNDDYQSLKREFESLMDSSQRELEGLPGDRAALFRTD